VNGSFGLAHGTQYVERLLASLKIILRAESYKNVNSSDLQDYKQVMIKAMLSLLLNILLWRRRVQVAQE
jgi:hypothetical protein